MVFRSICLLLAISGAESFAPTTRTNTFLQRHATPFRPDRTNSPSHLYMSESEPNDFFGGLTSQFKDIFSGSSSPEVVKETFPPVVTEQDFKLAAIFLTLALGLVFEPFVPYVPFVLGGPVTLLGVLFLVQTFRVRFVFTDDAFELKMGDDLKDTGENIVVGGENSWSYDSIVNWEFFPKGWIDQPQGPILVYFKETQTPSDQWNVGPGEKANSDEALANGAVPGQVHFFPALCNTKQLREEFTKRGVAKL